MIYDIVNTPQHNIILDNIAPHNSCISSYRVLQGRHTVIVATFTQKSGCQYPHKQGKPCASLASFLLCRMRLCSYDGRLPCWALPDKNCFGREEGWRFEVPSSSPNAARALKRHLELHRSFELQADALRLQAQACCRADGGFACTCGYASTRLSRWLNHTCRQDHQRGKKTLLSLTQVRLAEMT